MSSISIVSDAPNCGITYDCHNDICNSFIIQATGVNLLTPFMQAWLSLCNGEMVYNNETVYLTTMCE